MKRKQLLIGLSAFILIGCASTDIAESRDVNQAKIHQNLDVEIDESSNNVSATAQFRFGGSTGTTLRLSDQSNITLNGKKMIGESTFFGQIYNAGSLALSESYEFVFTDVAGKKYANKVDCAPVELKDFPETIDNRKNYTVVFDGKPIGQNERVSIIIKSNNGSIIDMSTSTSSIVGSNSINLDHQSLKRLVPGPGQVQVVRESNPVLHQATDEGGSIRAKFSSKIISVDIIGINPKPKKQGQNSTNQQQDPQGT